MAIFHHHPDGLIYVRTPGATYMDTVANFELDLGAPAPALPRGADDRIYDQGKRHAVMGDGNVVECDCPMPWPMGDEIIANVDRLLAAQAERRKPLPPTDDERRAAMRGRAIALLAKSDAIAVRFSKAGLPFPDEWRSYDALLRAIARNPSVNDPDEFVWPPAPPKPENI